MGLAPMCDMTGLLAHYVDAIERGVRRGPGTYWCGSLGGLSNPVRNALLRVERHRFLEGFYCWDEAGNPTWVSLDPEMPDPEILRHVYTASVGGLAIKLSPPSSSSSPFLMAIMLEFLGLTPGMRVLEIGTGTGYNAALLAEIVGSQQLVTTLDIQPDLVERGKRLLQEAGYGGIQVHCTDGFRGWAQDAPYDRIVATTCCVDISAQWLDQLAGQGWALVPLCHGGQMMAPLCQVYSSGRGKGLDPHIFAPASGDLCGDVPWPLVNTVQSRLAGTLPSGKALLRLPVPTAAEFWAFVSQFHYFVALNEANASFLRLPDQAVLLRDHRMMGDGAGLVLEGDWVRITGRGRMCKRLVELYNEYEQLGYPRVQDYEMAFSPRAATPEARVGASTIRRLGPREWTIERRFTTQHVWLPI